MNKNLIFPGVIFLLITISGCATIFSGSTEEITLESDPSGVVVMVNGVKEGTTPMIFVAKKGKEYNFEFVKKGYQSNFFKLVYNVGAGWVFLDVLTGILGIAIDAATGNWNIFEHDYHKATLMPDNQSDK